MISGAEFRAIWRLPCLSVRLAKHRLLFLLQPQRQAPTVVWDMVLAEDEYCRSSWLHAVRHALSWLSTMSEHVPAQDWAQADILVWIPQASPAMIRRAVSRHLTEEQTIFHAIRMHRSIHALCVEAGVGFDTPRASDAPLPGTHQCQECDRAFAAIQGLNAHRWTKHGHISQEHRFVYSGTCECCSRCFWTSQRLQQHLKHSRRNPHGCFWWVLKHLDPLDAPVEVRIPNLYRGQYRLPWVYAPGPAQTIFVTAWERRHQEHWHIWQTYLSSAGFPDELDSTICSAVWLTMTKTVVTWGTAPEENLPFLWSAAIDAYEASGQVEYHHAIWSFALWGRQCVYDLLERFLDPELQLIIERQYLDLYNELPVWGLVGSLGTSSTCHPA